MGKTSALRALDAFSEGLRAVPVLTNDVDAWGGVCVCDWNLPWLAGFALQENDDFVIAYHSAGSRRVRAACNGPWSDARSMPGLISVIPPGKKVEYRVEGKVCFSSLHVPRRWLDGVATSTLVGEPDFRFAFEDEFVRSCMKILLNEARAARTCNFPYVHAVTRAMVLHLMSASCSERLARPSLGVSPDSDSGVKLDALLDLIDARLGEPLRLNDLAEHVGVSRAHFARRFRALTGVSPHHYLILRRVEKAKQLLRETSASMVQIALDVGFSNQSHFTQMFHATTGQTPSQYRRAEQGVAVRDPGAGAD